MMIPETPAGYCPDVVGITRSCCPSTARMDQNAVPDILYRDPIFEEG